MKKASKIISVLLVLAMLFAFAACNSEKEEEYERAEIRVAALAGPTGVGMVKLMADQEKELAKNNYQFELVSDPQQIVAGMTGPEASYDIAACPVNMAAVLYNKLEGDMQVLAVNTKGVLYILENGTEINSLADLAGKTLYATGKGSTPEYILSYLLEKNGLTDKVTVEYTESHDELAALAASGKVTIAMLPEPKVTAAVMQNKELRVALNLTEEFEKVSGKTLIQGVVVAKKSYCEANSKAVDMFLSEYKASVDYTSTNLDDTANFCEQFKVIPKAAMAKKAIPSCNITYIDGADMKAAVEANLQVFFDANPKSIGGKMPAADFYYGA